MNYNDIAKKVARANSRLRSLEKKGYDYYAYDIAEHFTENVFGSNRYRINRKMDKQELRRLNLSLDRFLSSESSTIRGQKRIESERLRAFESKGLKVGKDEAKDFLRFLGDDGYRNLTEAIGYDATIFKSMIESYNNRKDLDYIERALNRYYENETSYAELIRTLERHD